MKVYTNFFLYTWSNVAAYPKCVLRAKCEASKGGGIGAIKEVISVIRHQVCSYYPSGGASILDYGFMC